MHPFKALRMVHIVGHKCCDVILTGWIQDRIRHISLKWISE